MSEHKMPKSNNPTNDQPEADDQASPAPGAAAAPDTATTTLNEELAETQRQRDECRYQLQRTRAEFLNYQRRAKAQADADRTYAIVPLALDLIAVLDNFERATEAARSAGAPGIVEGLDMVQKQLMSTLKKHGIETIPALGQTFDPNLHEALTQMPDRDHPEGTVVAELGKGYRLLDRVLRPAQVAVSIKPPQS
jgi:molecular chaperone GrpE